MGYHQFVCPLAPALFSVGKTCDAQSFSLQTQVVKSDGGGFAIRVLHPM
jgi:hypothetical protein